MGSREEFLAAVRFIDKHKIEPVVDAVLAGLDDAERGFELLKQGGQFGKVRAFLSLSFARRPRATELTNTRTSIQVVITIAKEDHHKL